MFPAGPPGVALLVLRNCIAFQLAGCAFRAGWPHALFILSLSLLSIGFLTPAICGISAVAVLLDIVSSGEILKTTDALIALSSLSLCFLGPGAYSVDAIFFARRIVVSTSSTDIEDDSGRT